MNDETLRDRVADTVDRLDDVELASIMLAIQTDADMRKLQVWPLIEPLFPADDPQSIPDMPPVVRETFMTKAHERAEAAVATGKPKDREYVQWMTTDASANARTPEEDAALLYDITYAETGMALIDDWRFLLLKAPLRNSIDSVVRKAAVGGLIRWKSKAVDILTDVSRHDPFPEVRQLAKDGLEVISQVVEFDDIALAYKGYGFGRG